MIYCALRVIALKRFNVYWTSALLDNHQPVLLVRIYKTVLFSAVALVLEHAGSYRNELCRVHDGVAAYMVIQTLVWRRNSYRFVPGVLGFRSALRHAKAQFGGVAGKAHPMGASKNPSTMRPNSFSAQGKRENYGPGVPPKDWTGNPTYLTLLLEDQRSTSPPSSSYIHIRFLRILDSSHCVSRAGLFHRRHRLAR